MKNIKYVDGFREHYTELPCEPLFDTNLTSDAKVVLLALFALPYDFHITTRNISMKIGMSETRVKNAIKRLKKTGYISIELITDKSGFCGYCWHVSGMHGTFTPTDTEEA